MYVIMYVLVFQSSTMKWKWIFSLLKVLDSIIPELASLAEFLSYRITQITYKNINTLKSKTFFKQNLGLAAIFILIKQHQILSIPHHIQWDSEKGFLNTLHLKMWINFAQVA